MKVYIVIFIELIHEGGVLQKYLGDTGTEIEDVYDKGIKGVYITRELAEKNCDDKYDEYIEEYEIIEDKQAEMDLRSAEIKEWKEYLKKNPEKDITKKILSKYNKGE